MIAMSPPDYAETDRLLVRMKKEPEKSWLGDVSCVPLGQALRHLNASFVTFLAGDSKDPRFHRKHDRHLTVARMGAPLDIRWTRPVGAEPTSVTVGTDPCGRYFVSFSTEEEIALLPVVDPIVGVDLGLLDAVAISTGEKVGNERCLRQDEKGLARAQRCLARKRKGSRNRAKARVKVARIHGDGTSRKNSPRASSVRTKR